MCRIGLVSEHLRSLRERAKEQRRKELQQRRKEEIKEVRVKPGIAEHDLGIKLASVQRFLDKGLKAWGGDEHPNKCDSKHAAVSCACMLTHVLVADTCMFNLRLHSSPLR